ncbi:ABC-three component system protein [Pedobacter sp. FW305-3-2-15-E-R2A2]|uniref:ABC-three component system protein n=1 Tax=Pedobacter sp. FW305-3-2-15-E-R2A2 TaxID=3140251 RepID=UPI00314002BE
MTTQEKALARTLFKLKIHESDGGKYENIFTAIMNYEALSFQQIKPWGNIGDRKNDGYIPNKEIYFQVYAPEDIRNNYPVVITKLDTDFKGLLKQWPNVREFYFVINDKYHGVNADSEKALASIIRKNKLNNGGFITSKDLENKLFKLTDDQIITITGFLPDTNSITNLDFSVLSEVVGYIMKLPIIPVLEKIEFPDWDEKIKFNKLSPFTKNYLEIGVQKLGALNQFISNQGFLEDSLQEQLSGLYQNLKTPFNKETEEEYPGDLVFWEMVKQCSPRNEAHFESAVITILAKYFESCDIFEKNPDLTYNGTTK